MRRRELVRELTHGGCILARHGGRHALYFNPANGRKAPVPRHDEISESLAGVIRKQLGLETGGKRAAAAHQ